jgi:hypothetical protein
VAYEQTATPSVPSNNVEVFVRATPATIP